ncbi:MAG: PorV/PorQ family protein [Ignavibacteria bacterium]|nr:PorV/PorQ family protein [Ignavibacteria bacterium]
MRSYKIKSIIIILLLSICINAQQFVPNVSKRGTSAAQFLSISQGARAAGMGSAFVAVSDDPSALFWNPAGITKINGGSALMERTNWFAGINYNFVAITYNLGDYGALGVSFTASDIDEMNVTTIQEPEGTGETFRVSDIAISIAYAINLTNNFSIGFNPKFIQQSIWRMSATAFALDLGVQYITPFDGIVLEMSISNFGTKMKLDGKSSLVLYDPDISTTGNNGMIPAYLQTDEWELPLNFRVGLSYTPIKNEMHGLTIAVDASHPSDDYESINIGGEYSLYDIVFIRGGYKSLFLKDSEESYTFGFGIKKTIFGGIGLKVDYSYGNFGRLTNIQKFSLGINF